MAKRRIYIEGLPKPVIPKTDDRRVDSPPVDDFNYRANEARSRYSSHPIRHGNDYWPVLHTIVDILQRPVFHRIVPNRILGCDTIWYMTDFYSNDRDHDAGDRVWALVVRPPNGGLCDLFLRSTIRDISTLPIERTMIVSQNIRPLDKIRFAYHEYFIPEREFCYVGYPYR